MKGSRKGCEDSGKAVASIDGFQRGKDFIGEEDVMAVAFFNGIGEGLYLRLDVFL